MGPTAQHLLNGILKKISITSQISQSGGCTYDVMRICKEEN
jgi:hypothetical protein